MTNQPDLTWSREASVTLPNGHVCYVFQMGTYAVRAKWPDGTVKVRVLPRGAAIRHPHLDTDQEYVAKLRARFAVQTQPVVAELETML